MKKLAIVLAATAAATTSAWAFPDRPIQLIVPFSPGGGSDVAARVFQTCLKDHFDGQVLVKNVTGARGKIAEVEVRDARPTGYELLWAHQGMDMGKATGRSDYNYTAFEPVASTVAMNYGIFAGANSGIDSVATLKKDVKANPGKYSVGMALNGFSHFAALDFMDQAGIPVDDIRVIPMSGDKNRIVSAIQGNLTLVPTAVGAAKPYVKSDDLDAVAIQASERDPSLPDAKTAQEQGSDSNFAMYFTTFAPKGTPKDVIDTLAKAWVAAAKDPACQAKLQQQAMRAVPASGEELKKELAQRYQRIEDLADKFNLHTQK
ncbi:tripartite tricarboxylate transporter substrate binding protein [Pararhizobium mangrovi]|nr:tripartite tricarboxylate transporter substrate binding protein [Pararhizobium mangrovi]